MKAVCVFAGSRPGARPAYARAAAELGRGLAERGLDLVFGGGRVGLMGACADAALAAGGRVIGVIPGELVLRELAHPLATEMHVVDTMHERKALMERLSDAAVALPGGLGTFDELLEILTWRQLGIHAKPCAVLDVEGYFGALLALVDRAVLEGFAAREHRDLLIAEERVGALLDRLERFQAPPQAGWRPAPRP